MNFYNHPKPETTNVHSMNEPGKLVSLLTMQMKKPRLPGKLLTWQGKIRGMIMMITKTSCVLLPECYYL